MHLQRNEENALGISSYANGSQTQNLIRPNASTLCELSFELKNLRLCHRDEGYPRFHSNKDASASSLMSCNVGIRTGLLLFARSAPECTSKTLTRRTLTADGILSLSCSLFSTFSFLAFYLFLIIGYELLPVLSILSEDFHITAA